MLDGVAFKTPLNHNITTKDGDSDRDDDSDDDDADANLQGGQVHPRSCFISDDPTNNAFSN